MGFKYPFISPLRRRIHQRDTRSIEGSPSREKGESTDQAGSAHREKVLVCARLGDNIYNPGRARSIWALNTAQAVARNGYEACLLGRASNLNYDVSTNSGMLSFNRHLRSVYSLKSDITFLLADLEVGFLPTPDGKWELSGDYLERVMSSIDFAHIRDPSLIKSCLKSKVPFIYEDHHEDYHCKITKTQIRALNSEHCAAVVAITEAVRERLSANGVEVSKIIVEESGVDTQAVERDTARIQSWRRFLLGDEFTNIAFYGGGLQAERGIGQILGSAKRLQKTLFVIAGGTKRDQRIIRSERNSKDIRNVKICGYINHSTFLEIAQSSDNLLYTRQEGERGKITSPLKFFEYLSCGSPVVAYDIPSIRKTIVQEMAVTTYRSATGEHLAKAIRRSLKRFPWRIDGYTTNFQKARQHDWVHRENRILNRFN